MHTYLLCIFSNLLKSLPYLEEFYTLKLTHSIRLTLATLQVDGKFLSTNIYLFGFFGILGGGWPYIVFLGCLNFTYILCQRANMNPRQQYLVIS
jgi:hypothetical protein